MADYLTRTLDRLGIRYLDNRNGGPNYGRDLNGDGAGWLWLLCSKEELMERIGELNDCGIEVEYIQVRADNGKAPYHAYIDNGEKRAQAPIGYFRRETSRVAPSGNNNLSLEQRMSQIEEEQSKQLKVLNEILELLK